MRGRFIAPTHDYELGGMQLPVLMGQAFSAIFKSANASTNSYVGLTIANANVINRFGTDAQKKRTFRTCSRAASSAPCA